MKHAYALLRDSVRVALLLRPRLNPAEAGIGSFVAALALYFVAALVTSFFQAEPPRILSGWGIVTVLADACLTLVGVWAMLAVSGRHSIGWGVSALAVGATGTASILAHWPLNLLAFHFYNQGWDGWAEAAAWLSDLWWLFALIALARWLIPGRLLRAAFAGALGFAITAMPWWWYLPGGAVVIQDPAVQEALINDGAADDADIVADNDFDVLAADAIWPDHISPEQLMLAQRARMDAELGALRPRTPGKTNLYVVTFAGDGSENGFRNEVEHAAKLFAQRFDAEGHVVTLENNLASIDTHPLASLSNLREGLQGVARLMDPAEDILLLYLTSHGSADHELHVGIGPLPLDQVTPTNLADALKTTPAIRWKVIVVNACYSGGFIDALRDDSTLVLTSARSDRTSFGCGTRTDITWFGRALLAEALNETRSFPQAFELAKARVSAMETNEQMTPSEPQIATSRSIEAKLERWARDLPASAPVPFEPASKADADDEMTEPHP